MKALKNMLTVVASILMLNSCQWVLMESRIAERVSGESDQQRIINSQATRGSITECTTANGKKFYVQRYLVKTESKRGPLFVFGEIDREHFAWGGKGQYRADLPVERHVVIGYDDLIFCGITPPPASQRHPLGTVTMQWTEWQEKIAALKDPGLRIVSGTPLPEVSGADNDYAAACVAKSVKREIGVTSRFVLTPLAELADIPLTILGTAIYFPCYNVKYWCSSMLKLGKK